MTDRELIATFILTVAIVAALLTLFVLTVMLLHGAFRWLRHQVRYRRIRKELRRMQQDGDPVIRFR
jgi:uncharacterized membrane protein YciS (DUF1049 family)